MPWASRICTARPTSGRPGAGSGPGDGLELADWSPCGRATLLRTETLRQNPFRIDPRLGGHLELLCRLACGGARFHHSMATIAAGSLSFRERHRQLDASRRITLEYTSDAERARKAFADMRQELARAELPHLTAWQLVTRVGRVPGATRALKRRLRAIPWHRLTGAERREVRFGDDRPYGLVSATGLSSPEGWGCWTDGPRVSIELEPALIGLGHPPGRRHPAGLRPERGAASGRAGRVAEARAHPASGAPAASTGVGGVGARGSSAHRAGDPRAPRRRMISAAGTTSGSSAWPWNGW